MHATGLTVGDIEGVAAGHPGVRGLRQLGRTLQLVDAGAESPYESRTRLLLVRAGLPAPETQIEVSDGSGRVFARLDMGWRRWRVAVEYEGASTGLTGASERGISIGWSCWKRRAGSCSGSAPTCCPAAVSSPTARQRR